jgi:hypothetical protein
MSRIFCFGCSFTGYWYPTWADILIKEGEIRGFEGFNLGESGAGNLFINLRIWEMNAKYKFTEDDYILICWTGYNREDRWTKQKGWITPGNLTHQTLYNNYFIKNYHDTRFCAMRDSAIMFSTQLALKNLGVKVIHFSMAPLLQNNEYLSFKTFEDQIDIIEAYNIKMDLMPMMEYIGTMQQTPELAVKRIKIKYDSIPECIEYHPLPLEHLNYLKEHIQPNIPWLDKISDQSIEFVDKWTELLYSQSPVHLSKLGWQRKTPANLW